MPKYKAVESPHNRIWNIINKSDVSSKRNEENGTFLNDSKTFKGLAQDDLNEIISLQDEHTKASLKQTQKIITLDTFKKASQKAIDSIMNPRFAQGTGSDPLQQVRDLPNLYISPWEAMSLYSQKGFTQNVIDKKSYSILLNGFHLSNPRLSREQIEKIEQNFIRREVPKTIAQAICDTLVYGGSLLFPMFKGDTPLTMMLPIKTLAKMGIVGKDCIDYTVSLDRFNVLNIPITRPTDKDFYMPPKFFIPFLGCDVRSERVAKLVSSRQAGWLGATATYFWGNSDYVGWYKSYLNYKNAITSIPMMINQMSILARTINADAILATEGTNGLSRLLEEETVKIRDISTNNPISMDVMGDIKSIDRKFNEVPALLRLLRQDLASDVGYSESSFWSSEKSSFSGSEDVRGQRQREQENAKHTLKQLEYQIKPYINAIIIDTLGYTAEVERALEYTQISFDTPEITDPLELAEIGAFAGKTLFDFTGSQLPLVASVQLAKRYGGDQFELTPELMKMIEETQKVLDERAQEKHDKEMEELDARIASEKANLAAPTPQGTGKLQSSKGGYSRLQQHQKEINKSATAKTRESQQRTQTRKNQNAKGGHRGQKE